MALVKCKECGAQISSQAAACPQCGAKPPAASSVGGVLKLLLFVFIGVPILIGVFASQKRDYQRQRATEVAARSADRMPMKPSPTPAAPVLVRTPTPAPPPPLKLVSFECTSNSIGAVAQGRVRNTSAEPISGVFVVASFYTASGQSLGSEDAVIDFNPLLPGQESPFDVFGPRNPAYAKCAIDGFKHAFGETIPHD